MDLTTEISRPNPAALPELVKDILKERNDNLKDKFSIMYNGLFSYARYGEQSPLKAALSLDELDALTPAELVDRIHAINSYEHHVFYYGQKSADNVKAMLDKLHKTPAKLKPVLPAEDFKEVETTGNTVLFADHDMVQTELMMVSKAGLFDAKKLPIAQLFNEYFGSGLSSIVFQEIREAKALAYSAYASYTSPRKKEEAHYVRAFLGTQADKLNNAVEAMSGLMAEMPMNEKQFEGAKDAAMKRIESERTTKEAIYWSWDSAKRLGLDHDVRKDNYERIKLLTLADLKAFFTAEIKGRNYTYLLIGKESAVDMNAIGKLGTVRKLSKLDLFGYDAMP